MIFCAVTVILCEINLNHSEILFKPIEYILIGLVAYQNIHCSMCSWWQSLSFNVLAPAVPGCAALEFAGCGGFDVEFTFTEII